MIASSNYSSTLITVMILQQDSRCLLRLMNWNGKLYLRNAKRTKKYIYYIDTDEIPGFLLLLKNHIFTARCEDAIFIFHV